jgi:predicted LPLAT superfamily acyltransferase
MSVGWEDQRERGSRSALAAIRWIALHLGRGAARALLYPISIYFLLKAVPQRQASRRYLSRVFGKQVGWNHVLRHFHCFAATILDRVYLLAGRHREFDVRFHGEQPIRDRLAGGHGFLLLGSHLGSFEILRALAIEQEHIPLRVLMKPDHNQLVTELLDALSPAVARSVIPLGTPQTLLAVKESLDEGYAVGLLGDRCQKGEPFVPCRFIGGTVRFPAGPLTLAAISGVPVMLVFGLYRGGTRYDLYFEELAERVPRDAARQGELLRIWMQRYADRLEHHARLAPYNWFNFFDFWDEADGG